jgi:hypothetical protein
MSLTHYFAIGPVIALLTYAILRLRGRVIKESHREDVTRAPRLCSPSSSTGGAPVPLSTHGRESTALRAVLLTFVIAGIIGLVTWGPFLWRQLPNFRGNNEWTIVTAPGSIERSIGWPAVLPIRFFIEVSRRRPLFYLEMLAAVVYVLPIVFLRHRPELLLWTIWLIVPVAIVTGIDLSRSTVYANQLRYTLVASPAMYVLTALALSHHRGLVKHLPPLFALTLCLAGLPGGYDTHKPDWRDFAGVLNESIKPGDAIIFAGAGEGKDWFSPALYLNVTYYARPAQGRAYLAHDRVDPSFLQSIGAENRVWLVSGWGINAVGPEQILPGFVVAREPVRLGALSVNLYWMNRSMDTVR